MTLITSVSVETCDRSRRADFSWHLIVPDEARIRRKSANPYMEAVITDPGLQPMSTKAARSQDLSVADGRSLEKKKRGAFRVLQADHRGMPGRRTKEAGRAVCNFLALLTI